jgi:hypothetical protein
MMILSLDNLSYVLFLLQQLLKVSYQKNLFICQIKAYLFLIMFSLYIFTRERTDQVSRTSLDQRHYFLLRLILLLCPKSPTEFSPFRAAKKIC